MHRVRASASVLRALSSSASASASASSSLGNAAALTHAASAVSAQAGRAMSAGSKRDGGMPHRRAGGMKLPDDDHTTTGDGKERYKSSRAFEKDEVAAERRTAASGEGFTKAERKAAHDAFQSAEAIYGSKADREKAHELSKFAMHQGPREPLRPGEQAWREKSLRRAGIVQQPDYKAARSADLAARMARGDGSVPSTANPRNPVLIRARQHLNPADLPPSFDHFNVPPLAASEIDAKEKALHASYWTKYAAWKEARPDEYARWVERLQKREKEQDYHFVQAQIAEANKKNKNKKGPEARAKAESDAIEGLKKEAVEQMLPQKHREGFAAAVAADPSLQSAVSSLGEEEVLRRWSAYQVFLDAEMASDEEFATAESRRLAAIQRDVALDAEDPLRTLHDEKHDMTIDQRKRIYRTLLGAKRNTRETPFWTDPDPRFEGPHDWKMADAFVRPPILPPLHLLRAYAAKNDVNSNFSALHKFLHFERLRQTITFLKEAKKKVARANVRSTRDMGAHLQGLIDKTPSWNHIKTTYPFLSDALLAGLQGLHLAPWAQKDQQDFLTALHRNVVLISKLLDSHFSRRNRNASWILSYPQNPRADPSEVLRPMSAKDVRKMEAEVLAQQLMQALDAQPEMVKKLEEAEERQERLA